MSWVPLLTVCYGLTLTARGEMLPIKIGFLLEDTNVTTSASTSEFEKQVDGLNISSTTFVFPTHSHMSLIKKAMQFESDNMDIIVGRVMPQTAHQLHRIFNKNESVQQISLPTGNRGGMHWYLNLLSTSYVCSSDSELLMVADCTATTSMAETLSQIIVQMALSRISLVYHSSYAIPASYTVKTLSNKGVRVQQSEIDGMDSTALQKALNASYYTMDKIRPTYVIFGDQSFLEFAFGELNDFDKRHRNLTVMSLTAKVIVWGEGLDSERILSSLHNLTNVVLLQQTSCIQDSYTCITKTQLPEMILCDVEQNLPKAIPGTPCDLSTIHHQSISKLFSTIKTTLSCNSCLQNPEFHVSTAVWTKIGRRLQPVTTVTTEKRVNVTKAMLFPNTQYGFNKMTLRISTLTWPPFVMKTTVGGKVEYSGVCMDLLMELARNMNFSFKIVEPEDQEWGRIDAGNWTGLIAQLAKREVDIAVAPMSIQTEREEIMDFISPFFHDYTVIMMKKPDENKRKWRKLIDPFHWTVILVIFLTLPFTTCILTLCERVSPCYSDFKYRRKYPGLHHFDDCFWYLLGALLTQGGVYLPKSQSSRTIVSFWWLFSTIVVATYSGNLIASLTVTRDTVPFKNIEEMTSQTTYKWGTTNGTYLNMLLATSKDPSYQKIWEGIKRFEMEDRNVLNPNHSVQIAKVKEGNYAYLNDASSMTVPMEHDCTLALAEEEFLPQQYSVGLQQDSPYKAMFEEQMMAIGESGLLEIWKRKWFPRNSSCVGLLIRQSKPMSLSDVQSAYFVLTIGILLAGLVVVYEFCRTCTKRP